ncbi:hypothetical protein ACTNE5_00220 [Acidaminococcus fermentans]|uniref:hypothetical protein n=1 Tax=Acidaminococcus fermentans TaxID=905 RepID=UPI003F89E980
MELIDIHMRLTPSQLFELSALVQKWQDHERDIEIKKPCPTMVLDGYKVQRPEITEMDDLENRKMFFAGVEFIRLQKGIGIKRFVENYLKMSYQNWYGISRNYEKVRDGTLCRIAERLGTTYKELVKKGVEGTYGKG